LRSAFWRQDALFTYSIIFLLDVSGSMYDSNKLPLVVDAMKLLTENLREEDRISIVIYMVSEGQNRVLASGVSENN